tara:strand:+ start:6887 stop:7063 length:177 start_codon:yes stop_codon:yes gene_type:complete
MILPYEEAIRLGFKIKPDLRKYHKPCTLNTPDCTSDCLLHQNTIRRNKIIRNKISKGD